MMKQKDAKDILREVMSGMGNVSPNDIQFNDLRKRKKKKRKKLKKDYDLKSDSGIIANDEGFEIIESGTKTCDYRDIAKKRKFKEKNSLEEWGAFDFFRFAHKLYKDKFKTDWDLNIGGNSLEINKIRDKFYDLFGFCCNLIMKDYIVYFFENHIDDFIKRKGDFYFRQMRQDWIIKSFKDGYNFQESFIRYVSKEKSKNKKYKLENEEIKKSFLLGDTTLVGNYGVVIALNWLLKIKKMDKAEAVKMVVNACREMRKKSMIEIAKNATEIYSPYPSKLLFKSPQLIFDKIDRSIQLEVEFNDNSKLDFLQKGN